MMYSVSRKFYSILCGSFNLIPFHFISWCDFREQGDAARLEPWTGEACFNKLSSEIRQRKADGIVLVSPLSFLTRLVVSYTLGRWTILAFPSTSRRLHCLRTHVLFFARRRIHPDNMLE